jgi:hypothetical protein
MLAADACRFDVPRTVLFEEEIVVLPCSSRDEVSVETCRLECVFERAGFFHDFNSLQLGVEDYLHLVFAAGFRCYLPINARKFAVCLVNERRQISLAVL